MTGRVDAVVIGAGVVGLAIARQLALSGLEVIVLEREDRIGQHGSSRNSEVIHAGLYYPRGSLKARSCVEGRSLLYEYCEARGIAHRRIGKLVVASERAQIHKLEQLQARAIGNGVKGIELLGRAEMKRLEPALEGVAALLSSETGIVDSHGLMLSLVGEIEDHGGRIVCRSPAVALARKGAGWHVHLAAPDETGRSLPPARRDRGPGETWIDAQIVVNAAGLWAGELACRTEGLDHSHVPQVRLAKGSWFSCRGPVPFSRLVYPLPDAQGLGIHLTLDLAGQARFGPDFEWVTAVDYSLNPSRAKNFATAIRRFWPGLDGERLAPAVAGIRSRLSSPDGKEADFCLSGPGEHGCPGLVNLFGIESPGLTAALSLARRTAAALSIDCIS